MQVYRDLAVLTARPSAEEEGRVPHRLYAHIDGATSYSAASFTVDAKREIEAARGAGRMPILVGGTGLYFRSLFNGLSTVPPIPEDLRKRWRERSSQTDSAALHEALAARDPVMARRLRPSDPQRIVRALEVIEATGRSLADWQAEGSTPVEVAKGWVRLVLVPDRAVLSQRIAARAETMIAGAGRAEVARLLDRRLDPTLPVMRAIGVAELAALVRGEMDDVEALERLVASTRRYAKRQITWFRTQAADWLRVGVTAP
jgi:tRNA dimethylallyltransferase